MTIATGTILDAIVADTQARNAVDAARALPSTLPPIRSLRASVERCVALGEVAVIAEHKRRSPSRGNLAPAGDTLATRVAGYEAAGAAGISVLTERDHFGGDIDDLRAARAATSDVPLLCKDFIVDEQQLVRARMHGADAVLLIAALHETASLIRFVEAAHALGLEVLLEVHDDAEMDRALLTSADLIGINARDLRTFTVDLAVVEQLASRVADRPVVAESGIANRGDAERVQRAGAAAVLVGELLMTSPDPSAMLRDVRVGVVQ